MVHRLSNWLILFFFAILLSPNNLALDTLTAENCENLPISCQYFEPFKTKEEQKAMTLEFLKDIYEPPYHDLVAEWNSNLKVDSPPEGTRFQSSETIKNAWFKLLTIFPSVVTEQIYVGERATVKSAHGFSTTLPHNYEQGRGRQCGRKPSGGGRFDDCRTIYTGNSATAEIRMTNNGKSIGTGELQSFTTNEVNQIEAELIITNRVSLDHYTWQRTGCCRWRCRTNCRCVSEEWSCRYREKDVWVDRLVVKDSLSAVQQSDLEIEEADVVVSPSNTPVIASMSIPTTQIESYEVETKAQTLRKKFLDYTIKYLHPPFNILYVTTEDDKEWYVSNTKLLGVDVEDDSETVSFVVDYKTINSCEINIHRYFGSEKITCNIIELDDVDIVLDTDSVSYNVDEKIELSVSLFSEGNPISSFVDIAYGTQKKRINVDGQASIALKPERNAKLITANTPGSDLSSASASTMITVVENKSLVVAVQSVVIIFLLIFGVKYGWEKFIKNM